LHFSLCIFNLFTVARGNRTIPKRKILSDPRYNSVVLEKFINHTMRDGKKSTARKAVYGALAIVEEKLKKPPMEVFARALKNIAPQVEVKTRRVGGANYQVPVAVQGERKRYLAMKWMIDATRAKKGAAMAVKFANELMAAYNNEGDSIKKKLQTEKMAESNRAFAFLRR